MFQQGIENVGDFLRAMFVAPFEARIENIKAVKLANKAREEEAELDRANQITAARQLVSILGSGTQEVPSGTAPLVSFRAYGDLSPQGEPSTELGAGAPPTAAPTQTTKDVAGMVANRPSATARGPAVTQAAKDLVAQLGNAEEPATLLKAAPSILQNEVAAREERIKRHRIAEIVNNIEDDSARKMVGYAMLFAESGFDTSTINLMLEQMLGTEDIPLSEMQELERLYIKSRINLNNANSSRIRFALQQAKEDKAKIPTLRGVIVGRGLVDEDLMEALPDAAVLKIGERIAEGVVNPDELYVSLIETLATETQTDLLGGKTLLFQDNPDALGSFAESVVQRVTPDWTAEGLSSEARAEGQAALRTRYAATDMRFTPAYFSDKSFDTSFPDITQSLLASVPDTLPPEEQYRLFGMYARAFEHAVGENIMLAGRPGLVTGFMRKAKAKWLAQAREDGVDPSVLGF